MREQLHDLGDVEAAFAGRKGVGLESRGGARMFASKGADQFCVRAVSRFDRDDVTADSLTKQGEVANDIENFVADEFLREAQRFLAQHGIAPNDDRVLE